MTTPPPESPPPEHPESQPPRPPDPSPPEVSPPELQATQRPEENTPGSPTHTSNDRSVLSVIRDIQQGALDPRSLVLEDRRRCVEHLTGEGYSLAEIAEILKVTERTVARDRSAVRQSNAIQADENITGEMVGQLVLQADTTINRIRRITRDSETPPAARIEGEKACWVVARDLVQKLQSLGYLPNAPQEIRGQMTHQVEHLPAFGQMNEEVARLELIVNQHVLEGDQDQQPLLEQLASVKDQVARGVLHEQITSIATHVVEDREVNDARPNESRPNGSTETDQRPAS